MHYVKAQIQRRELPQSTEIQVSTATEMRTLKVDLQVTRVLRESPKAIYIYIYISSQTSSSSVETSPLCIAAINKDETVKTRSQ